MCQAGIPELNDNGRFLFDFCRKQGRHPLQILSIIMHEHKDDMAHGSIAKRWRKIMSSPRAGQRHRRDVKPMATDEETRPPKQIRSCPSVAARAPSPACPCSQLLGRGSREKSCGKQSLWPRFIQISLPSIFLGPGQKLLRSTWQAPKGTAQLAPVHFHTNWFLIALGRRSASDHAIF